MATLQVPSPTTPKAVDLATVEAIIPSATNVDLQDLFEGWDGEMPENSTSMVPFIEQRQFLLLDELLTAYILLRIPALSENELKSYLNALSITVEARAVGQTAPKATDTTAVPVRDVTETIATETVHISEEPLICATEILPEGSRTGAEPIRHLYLFWKLTIPIGRPRTRFIKPSIFLNPIAFNKSASDSARKDTDDDYLPSSVPASLNLLGPLSSDSAFAGIDPHLPISRLYKSVPKAPDISQGLQSVKTGARRLFRAAPLFLWRLRFVQYPGSAERDAILACFDIEITQFAGCEVSLDTLALSASHGSCESIAADLPRRCQPAEQFTYIYKLKDLRSNAAIENSSQTSGVLSISLSATAFVSGQCTPKVQLIWQTALDLPSSRPVSLSGQFDSLTLQDSSANQDHTVEKSFISSGISLTITAPENVFVDEPFSWEIIIVNRSDSLQRLAIIPITKRKGMDQDSAFDRPMTATNNGKNAMEHPVLDENILFSIQSRNACDVTELVCLTPDVRIGSLGPSSCYVAHLKFLPLVVGNLQLQSLKLVDLTTQSSADVLQFPSIKVQRR